MEVAWRGPELLNPPAFDMMKKRAWGVDAQKVVQLMMGQLQSDSTCTSSSPAAAAAQASADEVTLDLLGEAAAAAARPLRRDPSSSSSDPPQNCALTEFLELDPDQPRLPSDWKTCLDLKTGKLSFVNKSTGITSEDDPRKQPLNVTPLMAIRPLSPTSSRPCAHEFLGSKESEILREEISLQQQQQRTSSSSSSGAEKSQSQQMLSFSTGTQLWNIQLTDTTTTTSVSLADQLPDPRYQAPEKSHQLELDLNLTAGAAAAGSPPPPSSGPPHHEQEQSVCTMEMVQRALRRTADHHQALDHSRKTRAWSLGSPATSSSSSTSRSSRLDAAANQAPVVDDKTQSTGTSDSEAEVSMKPAAESRSATTSLCALVTGACTRCLMYIMLDKSNPQCPRCGSDITLDFMAPSTKRQRVEQLDEALNLMTK
ncbi:unnamed protein product [Sphagnum troendelagicum]